MLEIIRTQGVDWETAFASTSEDIHADSGGGKRTRAYERVKKARQRLVNASYTHVDLPVGCAAETIWGEQETIFGALSSQFVADCAQEALGLNENGKSPGPLLRALAARLVAEACIADEAALSLAAKFVLREAALRFIALQPGLPLEPA